MSGADKNKLDPEKDQDEPKGRGFETMDFSTSTNSELSDPPSAPVDAYATQFADRNAPSDESKKPGTGSHKAASENKDFPTDIPGFVVESELGRGAFGVVYGARDQLLDRKVAIKKPLISNPAHRQQYIDEARKAVKLDHPSIVPIYQVGITTNDEPFVVQKLIEGSTLRQLLQNGDSRLPIPQTIAIMRQVCLAVDAAHAAGIVHRDLKPENLLVEPDGRVYVADFGLAILEDDEQNKKGREVAGTPLYMSPEQFAGRVEWLDGRSDIWALGVILYELLSGKTPFTGSSLSELKDQIKNKDPRPIHQRDPKIPGAFDALFRKCCAKSVGDRFASVREMIAELDVITESLPFLDTVNMLSNSRTGTFKALSSANASGLGSAVDSNQVRLSSHGVSGLGSSNSTVRNSIGGATIRNPNTLGLSIATVFVVVAILGALGGTAWYNKFGPFAAKIESTETPVSNSNDKGPDAPSVEINKSSNDGGVDPKEIEKKPNASKVVPPALPPSKPFRVSVSGNGTHDSIAAAIAQSDAGDTIQILDGTYRESIVIDRSIKLIGENTVRIIGTEQGCVKIRGDSNVDIEKITFDSQAPNCNAIEIVGGRLSLLECNVFASSTESYNCVKAKANATFIAAKCKFQTTVHAAVRGDENSTIAIRDSSFNFSGYLDAGLKRAGIQGIGAKGLIQRCQFVGPCITGIDWLDCPDQELTIECCQFENCQVGIQTKGCNLVTIKGSADQPCEIKNAGIGLSIKQSHVDLTMVNVEGFSDKNRVALQATEGSEVKCEDCTFFGFACGILIKQSKLFFDGISTRETSFVGMMVDGGTVVGDELSLLDVSHYGLVVLSKDASVKLKSLKVEAHSVDGQKLTPAVYVSSGRVEFIDGVFSDCLSGIFVDPNRAVINTTGMPERRSLVDMIGDPEKIKLTLTPVEVISDRMTLTNCDLGWMFNGIGTSRVKQLDGNLKEKARLPKLLDPELELSSKDLTNFEVVRKAKRK